MINEHYFKNCIPLRIVNFIIAKIISGKTSHCVSFSTIQKNYSKNLIFSIVIMCLDKLKIRRSDIKKEIKKYKCEITPGINYFNKIQMKVSFMIKLTEKYQYEKDNKETRFDKLQFDIFYNSKLYSTCKNNFYSLEVIVSSINKYYKLLKTDALLSASYNNDFVSFHSSKKGAFSHLIKENDYKEFCNHILNELLYAIFNNLYSNNKSNIRVYKTISYSNVKREIQLLKNSVEETRKLIKNIFNWK